MAEFGDYIINNYVHEKDFEVRNDLLEAAGLLNPERDNEPYLRDVSKRRPGAIKMARMLIDTDLRIWQDVGSIFIADGIGIAEGLVVAEYARNRGIGRALLRAGAEQLVSEGHLHFELQIDEGQDDLEGWYLGVEGLQFKRMYVAVGLMSPLTRPDRPIIKEEEQQLTHERVRDAFMAFYRMEYPGFHSRPSPFGGEDELALDTTGLKQLFKNASVPALQNAFLAEDGVFCPLHTSPWLTYASEAEPQVEKSTIAWARRLSDALLYDPEQKQTGLIPEKIPNDACLFLRLLEDDVHPQGRLPYHGELEIYGDYVCYDQANGRAIPFSIEPDVGIVPMSEEKSAIMLECLVASAQAYRMYQRYQTAHIVRKDVI